MKTSSVSRRMFLAGIGATALVPVAGKGAVTGSTFGRSPKAAKHRVPTSPLVLAAQWKLLAETKLAGQVPPGLARQIYRRILGAPAN